MYLVHEMLHRVEELQTEDPIPLDRKWDTLRLGVFTIYQKNPEFWLDCKWLGFLVLPDRKISTINGTSWEVVQNSQLEYGLYPNRKLFLFHFSTSSRSCANSQTSSRLCKLEWIAQMVHANLERNFPFRRFCLPFAQTVDQPASPSKW